jgi:hypothetical protein
MVTMSGMLALQVVAASVLPTLKATRVVEESGAGALVSHAADSGGVESADCV